MAFNQYCRISTIIAHIKTTESRRCSVSTKDLFSTRKKKRTLLYVYVVYIFGIVLKRNLAAVSYINHPISICYIFFCRLLWVCIFVVYKKLGKESEIKRILTCHQKQIHLSWQWFEFSSFHFVSRLLNCQFSFMKSFRR